MKIYSFNTGYNYNEHYSASSSLNPADGTALTFHFEDSLTKTDSLGFQRLNDDD
jgi:hypothetical protein